MVPGPTGGRLELRDVDRPMPGPGQLLVDIAAAGVNRGELIARPALNTDNPEAKARPAGGEFAGTVVAVGDGVETHSIGDRVMGMSRGCFAEQIAVPAAAAIPVPEGLSDAEAASIPIAFITAHDALVTSAELQPGESVLITAGSSGVGTAAIQIARYLEAGAIVATTRSPTKEQALLDLGATHVSDTTDREWPNALTEAVGPVAVVIDQVGGSLFSGLLSVMDVQGRFVGVGRNGGAMATIDLDHLAKMRLRLIGVTFRTRSRQEAQACTDRFVEDLLHLFAGGQLRPILDSTVPLDALPDAHRHMLSNSQFGKIVVEV
jgi:NADPH:quinone reductase-like Zn-dependent oxidoreductase